ncbi:23S rRNA (uracil(1939)-C(5))-methyltransferase RlmD [Vaginisenegalia massiliensis]|uniref:23S rRNA (uracil(1939)-C(5))-methyltransferase RlmD n=1 Tax=Vaginisenegalia massiliensis TaxID=2058294 RepID=UPI000F548F11|nr:23S rRNA (uracil(1939)-C(5))-methyltransferase RlmD [Vaginisenegalia massiliensis]
MTQAKDLYKKNQELEGKVVDLTSEGSGVVKIDDFPFFVEGALPGEWVKIKVMKVGKSFGFARLMDVMEPSPDRVPEKDQVGRQIGTMTLQHLAYPAQLKYKQESVRAVFQRLGYFTDVEVAETVGMDHPWEYRNKAQIPVREVKGHLETGFFRKNSHDLVPVENFYIQHKEIDQAIVVVRDILRRYEIMPYFEKSQNGLIRHIIVKRGFHTGEMMIVLVTTKRRLGVEEDLVREITQQLPNVVSIVVNVNPKNSNVILGKENRVIYGRPYYTDTMLGLTFRISPNSFFQVNTQQAEKLYQLALEAADLKGHETVLDAYCGIGTISLALARHAKQVYAMEIVPEAIEMANQNAQINKLDNVTFEVGAAEHVLPKWNQAGIKFDVVVVDPPRKGLDPSFVETLIEQNPEKIVYVSCNPATCARDCRLLADAGYQLGTVQPVDQFPQTAHVEALVLLTRESE